MLEVKEVFFIIVVSLTATISKTYMCILINVVDHQGSYVMNKHLCGIGIVFCSGEELLNWLNRRDRSEEGFNDKELFLLIYASLMLVKQFSSGGGFTKDRTFYLLMYQMVKFYYSVRCSTKNH